jgi:HSP20 family molecular chaperone IbpA
MLTFRKDPFFSMVNALMDPQISPLREYGITHKLEDENFYKLIIPVPGLSKEDISMSITDSVLKISYIKGETENDSMSFVPSFEKSYSLPDDANQKNVNGSVVNGVLTVEIPKQKKKLSERFISLN